MPEGAVWGGVGRLGTSKSLVGAEEAIEEPDDLEEEVSDDDDSDEEREEADNVPDACGGNGGRGTTPSDRCRNESVRLISGVVARLSSPSSRGTAVTAKSGGGGLCVGGRGSGTTVPDLFLACVGA